MLSSVIIALAAIATASAQTAEWHMDTLNTLVVERLDPIVSPNGVAGHMHRVLGGSAFGASYDFASARAASCTSASITEDKSNYWVPQLYWIQGNASFVPLPAFTRFYYKLGRTSGSTPVAPFPEGLRMLTGNPNAKSATGAATFTCHVNADLQTGDINLNTFNFQRDCPYGLRVEFFFPPCWDGKNLYSDDQSHMAYPTGFSSTGNRAAGQCPWDHPIRVPQIMLEYTFKPSTWAPGQALAGHLAWANGDTTGYGAHADFTNGWNTQVLAAALNSSQCAGSIGSMRIQDCQVLKPYYNPGAAAACRPDKGVMFEAGSKNQDLVPVSALPGCNPIWGNTPTKPTCDTPPTVPNVTAFAGVDGSLIPNVSLPGLPTVPGWQQLGCIKDTNSMLIGASARYYDTKLTATQCQNICSMNGMNYAAIGMSDSRWDCQCGTGIMSSSSWYPNMCVSPCPGDATQLCGGTDVHSIWYAPAGTTVAPSKVNGTDTVNGTDASSYLGCYSTDHSTGKNLISGRTFSFDASTMTNEYCVSECAKQGATWAATTNKKTCNCGKDYALGDGFYVSDVSCSWACSGDSTEKCGAYQTFFSVYNVTASGAPTGDETVYPPGRNGCFIDPGSAGLTGITWTNAAMTVDQCQYGCAELGYSLAGLTSGNRCRCGNKWNGGTLYPDSQCPSTCTGDKNSTCGGSYLTEVYQTAPVLPRVQADIAARPAGWSGCYTNSDSKLFTSLNRYDAINNVERCKATCSGLNYTWGAVENKNYCKCGSVDPSTVRTKLPSNVYCQSPCPGDKTETCGALGHYAEAYILQAQAPKSTSTISASSTSTAVSVSVSASKSASVSASKSTSSAPAPSSSPSGAAGSSTGCFADPTAMGGVTYNSGYMTVDVCLFYCKNSGYSNAGLQGNTCRCSNTLPKINVGLSYCTTPCASNRDQTCGSSSNIQVWPVSASSNFVDPYSDAGADDNGYMGCWNDWSSTRMLVGTSYSASTMTQNSCRFNCIAQGYKYSGTESGNQCWCSNSLTTNKGYQRRPDSECNMACYGSPSTKCGATWRISIRAAAPGSAPVSSSSVSSSATASSSGKPVSSSSAKSSAPAASGSAKSSAMSASASKASSSASASKASASASKASASASKTSSTSTAPSSTSITASGYQGCYALGNIKAAKDKFLAYAKMTPQYCQRYCMANGFDVGGLQNGNNCYCGSMSDLGAKQAQGACGAVCTGDKTQTCGDTFMASVYTSSPVAPGYPTDYVGCFNDGTKRVLSGFGISSGAMTSSMCGAICTSKGYAVYGTESGNECFCGVSLPTSMTGDEKCSYTCKGSGSEKCGGSYKLSVYRTGWSLLTSAESVLTMLAPANAQGSTLAIVGGGSPATSTATSTTSTAAASFAAATTSTAPAAVSTSQAASTPPTSSDSAEPTTSAAKRNTIKKDALKRRAGKVLRGQKIKTRSRRHTRDTV